MHLCTCPPSQVTTLQSVLENMTVEEMADTLIIIFIAETDPDSVFQISSDVQKQFHQVGALNPLTILTAITNSPIREEKVKGGDYRTIFVLLNFKQPGLQSDLPSPLF